MSDKTARELAELVGMDTVVAMGLADDDAQTFVSDEWVWHRAMEHGHEQLFMITNLLMDVQSKKELALQHIARVQDEAERATRSILKGQSVNGLGVFQNSPGQADVAIAMFQQQAQFLGRLCNSYVRQLQAAAESVQP
jgi:hypothetical protein